MIILGIDPAIRKIGWCVLESTNNSIEYINSGLITTGKNDEIHNKLSLIYRSIELIIAEFNPSVVAIENVFINKNPNSSITLSYAKGTILAAVGNNGILLKEIQANTIKKTITGNGKADKTQVQYMMKILLPKANPKSLDESDAIAIAYSGAIIIQMPGVYSG